MMRFARAGLVLALAVVGCEVAAPPASNLAAIEPLAAQFVPGVRHPLLPLRPGSVWVYEGIKDGDPRRDEVRVLDAMRMIDGVACTGLLQEVYVDGAIAERTTQWFAQALDGSIWQFAEESTEFLEGQPIPSDENWEAGIGGTRPWRVFSGEPRMGDVFEGSHGGTLERITVLALDAVATVPAGEFSGCVQTLEENPNDPEDADRVIYSPGVGAVSEESPDGFLSLVVAPVR